MTSHQNSFPKPNTCPKCRVGEIVMYTKPDGNYCSCNCCDYTEKMKMLP